MMNLLLVRPNLETASILKSIREKLRMTQSEFAEELGITRERYKNYEYSLAKAPDEIIQKARAVEATLQMPLRDPSFIVTHPPQPMRYAGLIPAGEWSDPFASETFEDVDPFLWHSMRWCATIEGFSCFPALHPGDFTIWHADANPKIGLLVAAERVDDHASTVKVLDFDTDSKRPVLRSLNAEISFTEPENGWKAIARLVCVIRRVEGLEKRWYLPEGIRPKHLV